MKKADRQAAERLRRLVRGEYPKNYNISFSYSGKENGKPEAERFSKNLRSRAE